MIRGTSWWCSPLVGCTLVSHVTETRRYWIEGASAAVPLYSSFSFSLNNRACQQLAKLLLLWRREEEEKVIEWGPVTQAVLGTDNAISTLERGDCAFVPFSFPWFQYLLTIRNR